jgi:hypothetical protein
MIDYSTKELGFDKFLSRASIFDPLTQSIMEVPSYLRSDFLNNTNPTNIASGETVGNLTVIDGYLQSGNYVAGVSGWQLTPTTSDLNLSLTVDEIHIPDEETANSFHTDSDGNSWWGAIDIDDSTAKILNTGAGTFSNITITGGSVATATLSGLIGLGNLDIATKGWSQTCVFSSTDADTVSWTSGTLTTASGDTYNISAGNTGNMAAKTYIYLDIAVSTTAYQTTTTASTAVGSGKILVAVAEDETTSASYMLSETTQIVGDNILANTVTAGKLSVTTLSSIVANLGTITAGNITLDSSGYIRGGATDYLTGTGFFLGYDTDAYKLSVGNPSGDYMTWDGKKLTVTGEIASVKTIEFMLRGLMQI